MSTSFGNLAMFLITGITNFACLPALYLIYRKGMLLNLNIGIFTMITSFMYHGMESLQIKEIYLTPGGWHKLDNIGSILCMITLLIYLMDNLDTDSEGRYLSVHDCRVDRQLAYIGLFITLLMQTSHPWHLENTVVPILLYLGLFVAKILFVRKPRYNLYYLKRGIGLLGIAVFCFVKGLDDLNDYLRIWHGCWHMFGSISLFFTLHTVEKDKPDKTVHIDTFARQDKFEFWEVFFYVYGLKFLRGAPAPAPVTSSTSPNKVI